MRFHPALSIAVLGHAKGNPHESGKGQIVNGGHGIRQVHTTQIAAILESVAADRSQPLRKRNRLQACAVFEGSSADHLQTAVFGKVHSLQIRAAAEGIGRQLGNTCANIHRGDEISVGVPRNVGLAGIGCHTACAVQRENAVASKAPCEVLAADAGCHNCRFTFHVGDVV